MLGLDVYSAVRTIGESGLDYIEIWGEVPHAFPDWVDKQRLKDSLSPFDLTVTLHAPFTDLNPATPFEPVKGAVQKTLVSFVKLGAFLGASMITVHPGSVHSEGLVSQSAKSSVSTLRALVRESDGRLSINLENQTKSKSKYHFPLASNEESIDFLLANAEGTRFTLDTGHAHVNGIDPQTLAERLGSKLAEVHLSDNSGSSDDHLIPGEGNAPLAGYVAGLAKTDLLVCLELDPHRYAPEKVLQAASETKAKLLAGAPG